MRRRLSFRILAAGLLGLGALVAGAGPAAAHADLLSTEPAYGAGLAPGTDRALLRFNYPVEVAGAIVKLEREGRAVAVGKPAHASPDHREVSVALKRLRAGSYVLSWFLFGKDGDVMGGELAFQVAGTAGAGIDAVPVPGPTPGGGATPAALPLRPRSYTPLSTAQDAARLVSFMALAVLLGGLTFVAGLWRAGARLARMRLLLWGSLATASAANIGSLGLKGAAVQGRATLAALSPSALTALDGTHIGRVLVLRLGFLLLAVPVVAYLTLAPERAVRSHRFVLGGAVAGLGALATHGMLSHAFTQGPIASAVAVVHVGAVAVWLGGLSVLAVVVLPRRRAEELAVLVPRWSRLAFASMATAVAAGPVLLILISPRWTALPTSDYGRFLLLKLVGVAGLLVVANRARTFGRRRLPGLMAPTEINLVFVETHADAPVPVGVRVGGREDSDAPPRAPPTVAFEPQLEMELRSPPTTVEPAAIRPFVNAVALELTIAASILAATAILVGRPPPV
jgi:copper transport protein